jgi:predicted nucleotidyltransferase
LREVRVFGVVVGNVAAILNDAPMLTRDVDIFVGDRPHVRKKMDALAKALAGAAPQPILEKPGARGRPGTYDGVRITTAVVPVDVLFRIAGEMTLEDIRARAKTFEFGGEALAVASLEDVIRSKEAAGRKKDRAALPLLRDTLAVKQKLSERM